VILEEKHALIEEYFETAEKYVKTILKKMNFKYCLNEDEIRSIANMSLVYASHSFNPEKSSYSTFLYYQCLAETHSYLNFKTNRKQQQNYTSLDNMKERYEIAQYEENYDFEKVLNYLISKDFSISGLYKTLGLLDLNIVQISKIVDKFKREKLISKK
jgi:hypothetical protein